MCPNTKNTVEMTVTQHTEMVAAAITSQKEEIVIASQIRHSRLKELAGHTKQAQV